MARRDVGKLGEKAFGLMCQQAGLLAHPPDQDRLGWDFLVEVPSNADVSDGLLDKSPPPLECRVQVKSTDRSTRRVSIALDHMLHLATLQMPVFFCVLVFRAQLLPERAYLVHLDEALIAQTLARVRRLGPNGSSTLHKHSLSIAYNKRHELALPFHEALRTRMTGHVSAGMSAYIAWKNEVATSAGYNEPRIEMNITFEGLSTSELVDFFLGLKKELNVQHMATTEHRFGIPMPIEPSGSGPAVLSLVDRPRHTDAVISFRKDRFSPAYELPAACYCPPAALNLPKDEIRLRFVARTCELMIWPFANRIEVLDIASSEAAYPLKDLAQLATVMGLVSEPSTPACLIDISLAGHAVFSGTLRMRSAPTDWQMLAKLTAAAEYLAARAGVADRVRASLAQLLHHKTRLMRIHKLLTGERAGVSFDNPDLHHPDRETGFLIVFGVPVGDYRIAGVFAIVGKSVAADGKYQIDAPNARIIRVFASPLQDEWTKETEAELLKLGAEILAAENVIPVACPIPSSEGKRHDRREKASSKSKPAKVRAGLRR